MARTAVPEQADGRARRRREAGRDALAGHAYGSPENSEQTRAHELKRTLVKLDLSPEEEAIVERFSRCLVEKLLRGPISHALVDAGSGTLHRERMGSPAESP